MIESYLKHLKHEAHVAYTQYILPYRAVTVVHTAVYCYHHLGEVPCLNEGSDLISICLGPHHNSDIRSRRSGSFVYINSVFETNKQINTQTNSTTTRQTTQNTAKVNQKAFSFLRGASFLPTVCHYDRLSPPPLNRHSNRPLVLHSRSKIVFYLSLPQPSPPPQPNHHHPPMLKWQPIVIYVSVKPPCWARSSC